MGWTTESDRLVYREGLVTDPLLVLEPESGVYLREDLPAAWRPAVESLALGLWERDQLIWKLRAALGVIAVGVPPEDDGIWCRCRARAAAALDELRMVPGGGA